MLSVYLSSCIVDMFFVYVCACVWVRVSALTCWVRSADRGGWDICQKPFWKSKEQLKGEGLGYEKTITALLLGILQIGNWCKFLNKQNSSINS